MTRYGKPSQRLSKANPCERLIMNVLLGAKLELRKSACEANDLCGNKVTADLRGVLSFLTQPPVAVYRS